MELSCVDNSQIASTAGHNKSVVAATRSGEPALADWATAHAAMAAPASAGERWRGDKKRAAKKMRWRRKKQRIDHAATLRGVAGASFGQDR
eukprot:scaffold98949_cov32-Tisochrysis_lutea.AAC.3